MIPSCSKCKRAIADSDINVATDVAFCRPCNLAHQLSTLVHSVELDSNLDLRRSPKGTWHSSGGLGSVVGATHRSIGTALGALAFSLFWNGIVSVFVFLAISATLALLGVSVPDWFPTPKMNGGPMTAGVTIFLWLFLTPFIVVGLAMTGAFLSALAGRTEVRLNALSGVIFTGIGPIGWRRRFKPDQVMDVRIEHNVPSRRWQGSDGDSHSKRTILIELQDGRQIKFGSSLREDRMTFVAAVTRKLLLP